MDIRPGSVRVLYVDSDEDAQRTVRDCLTDTAHSLEVVAVGSCEAALAAVEEESVDCVVSEYALPDGDGLELLEALRDRAPALPFVLYPSDGSEALAAEAVSAGATAYQVRDPLSETCVSLPDAVMNAVDERAEQQAALDRMTDGFHVLDSEWRIVYINDRGRELVRRAMTEERREAVDDLVGKRLWDVVPAAVDTVFYEKYHEAMKRQEPVTFEEYYAPMDAWFEIRAYPSPSGLSVYLTNITERKEYEQTVEHRESVLTDMHRIISDTDRSFEEKVQALFAIGRAELGTEYATLSSVDGDEYVFEHVQAPEGSTAIQVGDSVPLSATSCERAIVTEETLVVEDMAEEPAALADRTGNVDLGLSCYLGTPVVVDGEISGTFCFYGTEPRRDTFSQWHVTLVELMGNWASYERQRQRREAALTRERNRMEEFASVVSHDLRNPLNIATSRLELAADDCDSPHLDAVETAIDRMDALIEDVLALARLGEQVVDADPVDFPTLVRAAWQSVDTDDASLVLAGDADLVVGDEARLQRLFENLFRNSIEHGGDSVTVTVGPLAGEAGFYVEDDGAGIPADERDDVFDHGHTTTADGTGFGLSIVEQIVDAHGGAISVTESDDGGARFEIRGIEVR